MRSNMRGSIPGPVSMTCTRTTSRCRVVPMVNLRWMRVRSVTVPSAPPPKVSVAVNVAVPVGWIADAVDVGDGGGVAVGVAALGGGPI